MSELLVERKPRVCMCTKLQIEARGGGAVDNNHFSIIATGQMRK
jgi:hypothetical protein